MAVISQPVITEIENQHNVVYRGFFPDENEKYREQEHTNVDAGLYGGWLYADGTLVVPFGAGCEVFDPVVTAFTAASPEALDNLLRDGDTAFEK